MISARQRVGRCARWRNSVPGEAYARYYTIRIRIQRGQREREISAQDLSHIVFVVFTATVLILLLLSETEPDPDISYLRRVPGYDWVLGLPLPTKLGSSD